MPEQGLTYIHALRGTAFGSTVIYKMLSCPNALMFGGIAQAALPALQYICFLPACARSPAVRAACNPCHLQRREAWLRPRGRFQAASSQQATGSSPPRRSSHSSCLNPSRNQMVVNVLLLMPWSTGQLGALLPLLSLRTLPHGTAVPGALMLVQRGTAVLGGRKCLSLERIHSPVLGPSLRSAWRLDKARKK